MAPVTHPLPSTSPELPLTSVTVKQRLFDAMNQHILASGYDGFTVGDLVKTAGVSRSSFYAHFRDKDDLLLQGFDALGPPPEVDPATGLPDLALWLFSATEARQTLATTLLARPSREVVCQHLENTLIVLTRQALRAQRLRSPTGLDTEVAVRCHVGALIGLWTWWVDHDCPRSAIELASAFQRLSQSGLGPVLRAP